MTLRDSTDDVGKALRRMALLYRHFAETLQSELGAERAEELITKAVWAYGSQVGSEARERTLAKGLDLTPENYSDDLPAVGWRNVPEELDGEKLTRVEFCPLAHEWRDMDQRLARLYCFVDQAKMQAYNPDYTYVHVNNKLNGDACCRLAVRRRQE